MNNDNQYMLEDDQSENRLKENRLGDMKALFYLLYNAKEYRKDIYISLALILAGVLVGMLSARFIGRFIEDGLIAKNLKVAIVFAAAIIFLDLIGMFFQWRGRRLLSLTASYVVLKIKSSLFKKMQELPMKYYDRVPAGRIVTRITHDVDGVEEFFTGVMGQFISASYSVIVAIVFMLSSNVYFALIVIISIFPAVLFVFITRKMVRKIERNISITSSTVNANLSENVDGMEVIRFMGLENWSFEKYKKKVEANVQSSLKANLYYSWSRALTNFLCVVPMIALVIFGGLSVWQGVLSIGVFVAFTKYCERFINPIMNLAHQFNALQKAFTNAERLCAFLNETSEDDLYKGGQKLRPLIKGELFFDHVYMKYDSVEKIANKEDSSDSENEKWILNDVSFHIRQGEKIGLVGRTGSGKTTTVSLLTRLYGFSKGRVLVDNTDLNDLCRKYLRQNIGYVTQEVVIFKGSLRQNLSLGEVVEDRLLINAAKETKLLEIMNKNGMTLDSHIEEQGHNLSVGERQLLALTRILIRNPAILILDEATSNIDPAFEEVMHAAIEKIMKGRTCLIIAHRLDTLKSCDRLLVFKGGEIVEEGSVDYLIGSQGYFYNLHQANEKKLEVN